MQPLQHFDTFRYAFDAAHAQVVSGAIQPVNEPALLWAALNAAHAYLATPDPAADKTRAWRVAAWAARRLYGENAAAVLGAFPAFSGHLEALAAVGATVAQVTDPEALAPAPPPPYPPSAEPTP